MPSPGSRGSYCLASSLIGLLVLDIDVCSTTFVVFLAYSKGPVYL